MNYTVIIRCVVYNHEKYLRDCLNGFVMQKADFKFAALVHDDASTDSSKTIIEDYARRYPDLVIPFFEEENLYSRKDGSLGRTMREILSRYPSKYVAICEGDDYWTDPFKLQKQVDFLESNPDFSTCFHKAVEHWEDNTKPDSNYCGLEGREYRFEEIFQVLTIPTASVMFRREVYDCDYFKYIMSTIKTHFTDNMTWYCCYIAGRMMCLDFSGSVYRRQSTGIAYSVPPLVHMRNNFEYFKVMRPEDKHLARRQILFDLPQLLLDYRNDETLKDELLTVFFSIGIRHALPACLLYYSKRLVQILLTERLWQKLKGLVYKYH